MIGKDVTTLVDFENSDDEFLPLTKCVCGAKFSAWDFVLSIYADAPKSCPECGRKFYFRNAIRVFQVEE